MNKNKHHLVQLFLSIICFIIVFSGRLETVSDWLLLGGAVCACFVNPAIGALLTIAVAILA